MATTVTSVWKKQNPTAEGGVATLQRGKRGETLHLAAGRETQLRKARESLPLLALPDNSLFFVFVFVLQIEGLWQSCVAIFPTVFASLCRILVIPAVFQTWLHLL